MKVTYIHHSSFLVETDSTQLLFDYTEGPLPTLSQDKDLLIFVSHRHGDHFSPVIFSLSETYPRAFYILSDDIWENRVPEELYGKVRFMDPGAVLTLSQGGGTTITAYKSTDEGVAFAVKNSGAVIYHAGDLNNWYWSGETKAWNNNMAANYHRELNKMREDGLHPDVAMIPVDGRLEEWFYLGLQEFMDTVGAEFIFPMHFWDDFSVISRMKELPCAASYRDRIADIKEKGQIFEL